MQHDRPECWPFAMDFLGEPESLQVAAYVAALESRLDATQAAIDAAVAAANARIQRLEASLGAIHHRVCHGASSYGMGEAIAAECESAVPGLHALRAAAKAPRPEAQKEKAP